MDPGRNPNLQPHAYFDPNTSQVTYAVAVDATSSSAILYPDRDW